MKKLLQLLTISILCTIFFIPNVTLTAATFTDTSGHWAEGVIEQFYQQNIISGFPDGSFRPNQDITRAELARILALAFDLSVERPVWFFDANPEAWYYEYLKVASSFIPTRQFAGRFAGDQSAHRIDVAEALILIKMHKGELDIDYVPTVELQSLVRNRFNDSEFHFGDIRYPNVENLLRVTWTAYATGIAKGDQEGYFRPYWGITRAELLVMIDRVLNL